jgi:SAM-dependent methyltransferase
MHQNSRLLFEKYAIKYFSPPMKVLEIGPSGAPTAYQKIINNDTILWHTLDIRNDTRYTYSGVNEYNFPVGNESYDLILSGQVIEHVKKIWVWMKELTRICKTGGTIITINPASWHFHQSPVDCWRIFPDGMKALYEESGIEVELSVCESLEGKRFPRKIPGKGLDSHSKKKKLFHTIFGPLGFLVECSWDTITIGKNR